MLICEVFCKFVDEVDYNDLYCYFLCDIDIEVWEVFYRVKKEVLIGLFMVDDIVVVFGG